MQRTVVLNVVGLSGRLLVAAMPRLRQWAANGSIMPVTPVLPALTCPVQATYLTGRHPDQHGIVANGWYSREDCEVRFWKQSNHLVQSPKIWERARALDSSFTCANLFWWFNMYSSVDISVTPRPMYPADGRKIPDIYTQPAELRDTLQQRLGRFPLFDFWGPATSIRSTAWIAEAARIVEQTWHPSLTLIYLPHLDYCLQRHGTDMTMIRSDLDQIDDLCSDLVSWYEAQGATVIVLSEYGITPVRHAVSLNRVLRRHGMLQVRVECGREILDAGASAAFAVADHQIAHIYVKDRSMLQLVRQLIESTPGVASVLDTDGQKSARLLHGRSGDLVAIAASDAWFTYYYWLDDELAPDFATTVDIHRKPGYDPVELFFNPAIRWPRLAVGKRLLMRKLGFRTLMDVIPLDASLVKGSHGCVPQSVLDSPVLMMRTPLRKDLRSLQATQVHDVILGQLFPRSSTGSKLPELTPAIATGLR